MRVPTTLLLVSPSFGWLVAPSFGWHSAPRSSRRDGVRRASSLGSSFSTEGCSVYDGAFTAQDCGALDAAAADGTHRAFLRSKQTGTILESALDSVLTELGDDSPWVEYWSRSEWKHLEAHSDCDEQLAVDTGELRFPKSAHVLALRVGLSVSGPTCIWSADVRSLTTVPAVEGRLTRFDGRLMHAVPRPANVWLTSSSTRERDTPEHRRSVVLFNTWDEPPRAVPTTPQYAIPFPDSPVSASPRATWVEAHATPLATREDEEDQLVDLKVPLLGSRKRRATADRFIKARASSRLEDALREPSEVRLSHLN